MSFNVALDFNRPPHTFRQGDRVVVIRTSYDDIAGMKATVTSVTKSKVSLGFDDGHTNTYYHNEYHSVYESLRLDESKPVSEPADESVEDEDGDFYLDLEDAFEQFAQEASSALRSFAAAGLGRLSKVLSDLADSLDD